MAKARRLVPYLLALLLVVLLLWQIDPTTVWRLLSNIDPYWLLIGFGFYVLTNILRAFRFSVLMDLDGYDDGTGSPLSESQKEHASQSWYSPLRILPEMFALSLFNNVLPSRSGELSFPYFMVRRHAVPVGESSAALIVARVFDYLAVAVLFVGFALLNLNKLSERAESVVSIVAALLLVSLVILAAMPWLGRQIMRFAQGLMQKLGVEKLRWVKYLLRAGWRAVEAFEEMRSFRTYGLTFGWSLLTWLATFAWFAAFMQAIGLPQAYPLVIVGGTFAMLAKAIPFVTVGGFGAHEAGWALGFSLVGMETALAIASGFAVNILTLLASLVFGGASLLWMRFHDRRASESSQKKMCLREPAMSSEVDA
ncbi:MAG: lysylphosphatidylglycerol synthase transmembrane domain-containing protein [Chloroflexota bacterium]|nr:lysylphosphatidylglycerol synthase transmembrane domain-containing protein [Chloroflexota bacterium]